MHSFLYASFRFNNWLFCPILARFINSLAYHGLFYYFRAILMIWREGRQIHRRIPLIIAALRQNEIRQLQLLLLKLWKVYYTYKKRHIVFHNFTYVFIQIYSYLNYIQGHTGGGFRRNSVSDGADSLSRSASDSSVSNPGGSSHNNKNGNGGAMGNGSSNGLG